MAASKKATKAPARKKRETWKDRLIDYLTTGGTETHDREVAKAKLVAELAK